ncbi:hypothetical protein [Pedobacter jejuensis]|uniref:Uncharacterized protein n=1 Tax=Pedobacter jejuensis TaxID=1268550 RepID=A0A3N0BQM0_9SPHI|nr:hypothetical protein [Pedobacter jejuensis]RNL51293.1 hypothetical protein D7004_16405 [Pedobacter jejuensis]
MKTSAYRKDEHIEGYVDSNGSKKTDVVKSDVQKKYEKQNEGNEVTSYGKESSQMIAGNPLAKDGYDNSGTQGKDSLSDDSFNSTDERPSIESASSHTASSSDDFDDKNEKPSQRNEDDVLNSGI